MKCLILLIALALGVLFAEVPPEADMPVMAERLAAGEQVNPGSGSNVGKTVSNEMPQLEKAPAQKINSSEAAELNSNDTETAPGRKKADKGRKKAGKKKGKDAANADQKAAKAAKHDRQPDKITEYAVADGTNLKLFIYYPKGWKNSDRRTLMLMFHGGGWYKGNPQAYFLQCREYAEAGFVAISAEYRLADETGDASTLFRTVADGKAAFRYVASHPDEFGIDPKKIVVSGSSAGGHIAIGINVLDIPGSDGVAGYCSPAALVLACPVLETGPKPGYAPAYRRLKEQWKQFSPFQNLRKDCPPQLILVGTKDHVLPKELSSAYVEKCQTLGCPCKLQVFEGVGHGAFYRGRHYAEAKPVVKEFLEQLNLWPQTMD